MSALWPGKSLEILNPSTSTFLSRLLTATFIFSLITQSDHAQRCAAERTERSCGPADAPLGKQCPPALGVRFLNLTKVPASSCSAGELLRKHPGLTLQTQGRRTFAHVYLDVYVDLSVHARVRCTCAHLGVCMDVKHRLK